MHSHLLVRWLLCVLFTACLFQAQGHAPAAHEPDTAGEFIAPGAQAQAPPRFKQKLNVALHGQVTPGPTQVVGSVITTDGLRAALMQREDVGNVRVFYPFHYEHLFEARWDVVIIEGWFLMIHDFIQIVRSHCPDAVVLFYCLDPSFPGMRETLSYDVDGYLTNSRRVLQQLQQVAPSLFLPLAADPLRMRPSASPDPMQRRAHTVFVGAGGKMLQYKPELLAMVRAALPFDLRLYGMGWAEASQPAIRAAHMGVLPRWGIASVYASAQVVLGSTIEAQRQQGMVNNRVFEAMSCGAVLLTDHSPELAEVAEGNVLFANSSADVAKQLQWVRNHPAEAAAIGRRARALVLQKHTWGHRAVQALALAGHLRTTRSVLRKCCARPNCPTLAWVVSAENADHPDYTNVVHTHVFATYCRQYRITEYTQEQFLQLPEEQLARFEAVLAVLTPFDTLHLHISALDLLRQRVLLKGIDSGFGRQQKWLAYVLGLDLRLAAGYDAEAQRAALDPLDLLLFRSHAEMGLFRQHYASSCHNGLRCEHLFGFSWEHGLQEAGDNAAGNEASRPQWFHTERPAAAQVTEDDMEGDLASPVSPSPRGSSSALGVLVVCYHHHLHMCSSEARRALISPGGADDLDYHLLLVGGSWDAWMAAPGVVVVAEPTAASGGSNVHRIVHVPAGNAAWLAHSLFSAAKVVYFMHDAAVATGSTIHDVTWPLLLAAQIGSIGPLDAPASAIAAPTIKLAAHNQLLMLLARDNIRHWNASYLDQCSSRAVCKTHGLGSGATAFEVKPLGTRLWNVTDAAPHGHAGTVQLVMRVTPQNFMLGRDGDCCFHVSWPSAPPLTAYNLSAKLRADGGSKLCLLRLDQPVLTLQVDLFAGSMDHMVTWSGETCANGSDGNGGCADGVQTARTAAASLVQRFLLESWLDVTLRGNVFADPLTGHRLSLRSFYDAGQTPRVDGEEGVGLEAPPQLLFLNATM